MLTGLSLPTSRQKHHESRAAAAAAAAGTATALGQHLEKPCWPFGEGGCWGAWLLYLCHSLCNMPFLQKTISPSYSPLSAASYRAAELRGALVAHFTMGQALVKTDPLSASLSHIGSAIPLSTLWSSSFFFVCVLLYCWVRGRNPSVWCHIEAKQGKHLDNSSVVISIPFSHNLNYSTISAKRTL